MVLPRKMPQKKNPDDFNFEVWKKKRNVLDKPVQENSKVKV